MDSELYLVKQQFTLGAYKSLVDSPLPDASSPDYHQSVLYHARAHIALSNPGAVARLVSPGEENVALKAVSALARYVAAEDESEKEEVLEQLRDLCVEIEEGEDSEEDKGIVRVLAGTAFIRAGETEEALETLGVGTDAHNLEATSLIVYVYLSINRPDLARKEFDRAKDWAEDDLLLQSIESSIGLVTGRDSYSDPHSFFTEQIANPTVTSPHLLTARGITRLLRGEIAEARSDLEESLSHGSNAETLAASVVAAGLGAKKTDVSDPWSRLTSEYPSHPLIADLEKKAEEFDQFSTQFSVPPLAVGV
ncbi:hypothetical protein PUNSTDRAFT_51790 [Punctularia strigosozonata HHB-11173 SS5]|uniref:uncharacterized protein n=1 Tax=Punctularia strigosozonata (strain HHB-11173) TaxID=741275 RepID=UPI00044180BE|nr:uncharacterized protein PUNSTDRAFT_51790 [Punctularia strigosozonata HHB-11173 SS5]EIN09551.1 hypothetical protein PUNSTDRAFT_51790 [Punctularia strigosozonata HHB-11173 SS5]